MKFENIRVYNFEGAIRGMRNPKNSWNLSDSCFGIFDDYNRELYDVACEWTRTIYPNWDKEDPTEESMKCHDKYMNWLIEQGILTKNYDVYYEGAFIGPKDMKLMQQLIEAGSEHRKFMRQIFLTVDITAPLFWWKEMDTYKVGTVANSCSTMHKILSTTITKDCFEMGDFNEQLYVPEHDQRSKELDIDRKDYEAHWHTELYWDFIINHLEDLRQACLKEKDQELKKKYWKELIRALPESWLQKRTWTANYEVLLGMCSKSQRRFHKLTEWSSDFIKFARSLPYAQELIFLDEIPKTVDLS
jgi:hypothetical protein